jgi:CRP/FNR family nitrogen fixation transcriptional regulator
MLRLTSRSAQPDLLLPHCPDLCWATANYEENEEIYGEAEEAAFIFKVVSGAVRTLKLLDDGRRQIGAFYLPADVFGLESGSTHMMTAEAVTDARVVFLKRCALERAATYNIEVARWLLGLAAQRLDHLEEHVLLLGRKTAAERVAAFLLEMEQRLAATGVITLPMPRRDIADYLAEDRGSETLGASCD